MTKVDLDGKVSENAVKLNFRYHLDCNDFFDSIEDCCKEKAVECIKEVLRDSIWRLLCDIDEQKITTVYEISAVKDLFSVNLTGGVYERYEDGKGQGEVIGYKNARKSHSLCFTLLVERDSSIAPDKKLTNDLN